MPEIKKYSPVYGQLINQVRQGFDLLGPESKGEVIRFIKSQQLADGGFTDRGGHPDIYYSLFGTFIFTALKLDEPLEQLKLFLNKPDLKQRSSAEKFALILIRKITESEELKQPSLFSLIRILFRKGRSENIFYAIFLFLMVFDGIYGKDRLLNFFARIGLQFYEPSPDSPCSIFVAFFVARFYLGLDVKNEAEKMLLFYEKEQGFKSFQEAATSDMLSTAVALFALKYSGNDLRLVAPGCLDFVQENYDSGAFLSGDGDLTRDVEYTFYGLLALGTLV